MPLVFRNETQKIERLVRNKSKGATKTESKTERTQLVARTARTLQASGDPLTIPQFLLDSSWEYHGRCYFLDQFTPPAEPDWRPGPLDSIPLLYALCQDESTNGPRIASLRAALDAAAFASLANRANVPSLAVQARRRYGQA